MQDLAPFMPLWVIGTIAIGYYAASKGKSPMGWTFFASMLSPVIAFLCLKQKEPGKKVNVIYATLAVFIGLIPLMAIFGLSVTDNVNASSARAKEINSSTGDTK